MNNITNIQKYQFDTGTDQDDGGFPMFDVEMDLESDDDIFADTSEARDPLGM